MKTNHNKVNLLIRQALEACGSDDVLSATRKHLRDALAATQKVGDKRHKYQAMIEYQDKAKQAQKKWWDMILNNVGKLPEIDEHGAVKPDSPTT